MFHDNVKYLFSFLDRMVMKNNYMSLVDYDMDQQYSSTRQLHFHLHTKEYIRGKNRSNKMIYFMIMFIRMDQGEYD